MGNGGDEGQEGRVYECEQERSAWQPPVDGHMLCWRSPLALSPRRRPQIAANLRLRHLLLRTIRRYLEDEPHSFIEIETPVLTRSTPEGARDYLVPSRYVWGGGLAGGGGHGDSV